MSGAFPINRPRQFNYELRETVAQRRQRAKLLRVIYALADPGGWDARRHFPTLSTVWGRPGVSSDHAPSLLGRPGDRVGASFSSTLVR